MGGRGATSGVDKLRTYGTVFQAVTHGMTGKRIKIKDKRVLFIKVRPDANGRVNQKTPFESMRSHRIYALVGEKGTIKTIAFTDRLGMAYKFIDIGASHEGIGKKSKMHVHLGYQHGNTRELNKRERRLVRKLQLAHGELSNGKRKR